MKGIRWHDIGKRGIKLFMVLLPLVVLIGLFSIRAKAQGSERIINFNSQITVNQDSSMKVIETITVESTGNKIKRGIYRDFSTKYKDRIGNSYTVGFEVESVLRDGKAEKYRVENMANGKRVYIGREDYILPPGRYTYTIVYRTGSWVFSRTMMNCTGM